MVICIQLWLIRPKTLLSFQLHLPLSCWKMMQVTRTWWWVSSGPQWPPRLPSTLCPIRFWWVDFHLRCNCTSHLAPPPLLPTTNIIAKLTLAVWFPGWWVRVVDGCIVRGRGRGAGRCSIRNLHSLPVQGVVLAKILCSLTLHMVASYRNRRKLGISSRETCGKYQNSSAPVWFLNTFPSISEGAITRPYLREPVLESVLWKIGLPSEPH